MPKTFIHQKTTSCTRLRYIKIIGIYAIVYGIERGVCLTSLVGREIFLRFDDAEHEYLVCRLIARRRTTVIRIGMGWHIGCDDSGFFFGRKRRVDEIVAYIVGAHRVV